MRRQLWITLAAFAVCGANVAVAESAESVSAAATQASLACALQECGPDVIIDCEEDLGCKGCTEFPAGLRCFNN